MDDNTTIMDATKIGARNNRMDRTTIQNMHDAAVQLGATCEAEDEPGDMEEMDMEKAVTVFGGTIKALDDSGRVGGYLVRFSTADDPDLTGDYFTKDTDFGEFGKLPLLYHHGLDTKIGKRRIGTAAVRADEFGLWAEAQLQLRDEYEKFIFELAKSGKLGYSSGAAGHTVDRQQGAKAARITQWYMAEASLTPSPAEYRNSVTPIKSLIPSEAAGPDKGDNKSIAVPSAKENKDMEANEIKTLLEENNKTIVASLDEKVETAAKKAVEDVLDKLPEVKAHMNGTVQVTRDEADVEFKTIGEQLQAIAGYARKGRQHPRMKALFDMEIKAALGANEAIPSQGEFLLEPTITAGLLKPVHESGPFTAAAAKMPVGPNSNSGWLNGVDETSRAAGSRWGGVRGYHSAEAGTMTASQPKFRRINWELHKTYVLMYATDEVLSDAGQLTAIMNQSAAEELNFMANDDVMNGVGGDRPVGILQSSCLISVGRYAASQINHVDILNMWQRMPARSRANAVWYINTEAEPQLDALTFTSGSTGILSPYVRYDNTGVLNIKGRPVQVTEFNAALGSAGDIVLADMSEYLFWEKNAVEAASSIHVQFLTDQTAFRFIYRYDGQATLASAITPYKGTLTQSPFVCLASTTG